MATDSAIAIQPLHCSEHGQWHISRLQSGVQASAEHFLEITDLLLENVQLNSTHLFRADILLDTAHKLKTLDEKEANCHSTSLDAEPAIDRRNDEDKNKPEARWITPIFDDFEHQRTVIRRLIPRKPQLDKPLEQSCFIYNNANSEDYQKILVVYIPHCSSEDEMPWYHPKVRVLAYLFTQTSTDPSTATLSVHYLPFPSTPTPPPYRLDRTFNSLLNTMIRLLKLPPKPRPPQQDRLPQSSLTQQDILTMSLAPGALKDTILPQHTVQNTYTTLKQRYATFLIETWVEKTEPSKHVFEDLSIAAFLIELWKSMYVSLDQFPGFVDIACGNGVLTWLLNQEGWKGHGLDARRRKTWDVLDSEGRLLREQVLVPRPFLDVLGKAEVEGINYSDGVFEKGTFIISNHADELTCWTPVLAAFGGGLSFLAIPCCSHALDGSRRRYNLKDVNISASKANGAKADGSQPREGGIEEQPSSGSLEDLRASKNNVDTSMYACLARKTAALAQELTMDVELTLMRIPSTRNIGIVGNRKKALKEVKRSANHDGRGGDIGEDLQKLSLAENDAKRMERIQALLERECAHTGGVEASARTWIEKAKKLQGGQGRGKVNWNGPIPNGYSDS